MRLADGIYRLLLWLYPSRYRAEYGSPMALHFQDQLREAQRSGGGQVGRLWLHTLLNMSAIALAEHLKLARDVLAQSVEPLTWWEVALLIAPGLVVAVLSLMYLSQLIGLVKVDIIGLLPPLPLVLGVVLLLALAQRMRTQRYPAWGMIILGGTPFGIFMMVAPFFAKQWEPVIPFLWLGAGLLLLGAALHGRRVPLAAWGVLVLVVADLILVFPEGPYALPALCGLLGYTLMMVALGALLSWRTGTRAALFMVGAFYLMMVSDIIPAETLHWLTAAPGMNPVVTMIHTTLKEVIGPLLLLVVGPLLFARATTRRGQLLGLLLPVILGLVWSLPGTYPSLKERLLESSRFLFIPLAVALPFTLADSGTEGDRSIHKMGSDLATWDVGDKDVKGPPETVGSSR